MLRSLPAVVQAHPDVLYIVLGEGHPLALSGGREPYVDGLKRLVSELGIEANVAFETRFVDTAELCVYLRSADVYVTPYLNEEQITSGTLSFAMGSGIASVSTPYWYAREMLAQGRGRLVPFGDVTALGAAVSDLLSDDAARNEVRARAYAFSRAAVWSNVGARYLRVFEDAARATRGLSAGPEGNLPPLHELKLDHLERMTDNVGLLQHATLSAPNTEYGYCTDDNARALIFTTVALERTPGDRRLELLAGRFFRFVEAAFRA